MSARIMARKTMILGSCRYLVWLVLLMLCILEAVASSSAQNRGGDLSKELQSRGRLDGLALIRTSADDQWDVVQMGDEPKRIANPQGVHWLLGMHQAVPG